LKKGDRPVGFDGLARTRDMWRGSRLLGLDGAGELRNHRKSDEANRGAQKSIEHQCSCFNRPLEIDPISDPNRPESPRMKIRGLSGSGE
jgi:hypothetical protein